MTTESPTYTFLSASYANMEHSAAVAVTGEVGAVALSEMDTPAEWAALAVSGLAISPYSAPSEPVPSVVSAFQAKAALMRTGLYEQSEAAAKAAGGLVLLAWQTAGEFQRASPNIAFLAAQLGLPDDQVDELFRAAAAITA